MNTNRDHIPDDIQNQLFNISENFETEENIKNDMVRLINEIYEKNLYNGRSKDSMIAGVFYTVIKQKDIAISAKEISEYLDVDKRSLVLTNKYISNNLSKFNTLPTDWESYIELIDKNHNVDSDVIELSYEIGYIGVKNSLLSGKKPQSYAASCLYAASKITDGHSSLTQRKLSNELDISPSTIRASYNNLVKLYNNNDK